MVRVLIIAYTSYISDGRVKRHAQALAERGDHVDVICLENAEHGYHDGINVIALKVDHYRGASKTGYFSSYFRFFRMAISEALRLGLKHRYDIVIVCTMPDVAVLCALPLKLLGSKVVLDIHDTMPELYRDKFGGKRGTLGARLLSLGEVGSTWLADRVLAVHEPHRRRLEQAGVAPRKIEVVINVPDERIFARARNDRPTAEGFTIMYHGTIAERLGLDVGIRAMALLRDRFSDLRLAIVGRGDYLSRCKSLAAELSVEDRVRFIPPVSVENLPELLSQASLGLVPNHATSATHLMLPVKLLEYATMGIPTIAARLRTIAYYFDDSAVRFFEPNNPEDLARAIDDLYRHPALRQSIAANAQRIINTISWRQQRDRYYATIDSLLDLPREPAVKMEPS